MQQTLFWQISTYIIPLLLSIILHELAHGWMAYWCGDSTAKAYGRLSLNPVAHIDPVGSVFVPLALFLSHSGVMFGWARPVPVNFYALKDTKRDMGLVALAGPFLNFLLAVLFGILLEFLSRNFANNSGAVFMWFLDSIKAFFIVNLSLCAFNLFPILPLDGGRILVSVLPKNLSESYAETEKYGILILLGLLFILPMMRIDILSGYMNWMAQGLLNIITFILKGVF